LVSLDTLLEFFSEIILVPREFVSIMDADLSHHV